MAAALSKRAKDPFRSEPGDRKTVSKIKDMPADQQRCRIRHLWPSEIEDMVPGRPLPQGISVVPNVDGSSRVVETCRRRCGKSRVFDTLPGNIIPLDYELGYRQDKTWVTVDPDSGLTRRDIKQAMWNQVLKGRRR